MGGEIYDFERKTFTIKKGPIFNELVLIDEINRMHPKTQSAFLQCMEERKITLAGAEYELPQHHLIIATQNPTEYEGTFPLPEAQRDRFSCFVKIGYPTDAVQKSLLQSGGKSELEHTLEHLPALIHKDVILGIQQEIRQIFIKDSILDGLIHFINWTRNEVSFHF